MNIGKHVEWVAGEGGGLGFVEVPGVSDMLLMVIGNGPELALDPRSYLLPKPMVARLVEIMVRWQNTGTVENAPLPNVFWEGAFPVL